MRRQQAGRCAPSAGAARFPVPHVQVLCVTLLARPLWIPRRADRPTIPYAQAATAVATDRPQFVARDRAIAVDAGRSSGDRRRADRLQHQHDMNASTDRRSETNAGEPSTPTIDVKRTRGGHAMRFVRAAILVAVAGSAPLASSCVAELMYSHGSMIDGSAHEMFKLVEAGEIEKRPNLDDLFTWLRDESARALAAGRQPLYPRILKPSNGDGVPVLGPYGVEVPDAPEFGFVRYSGMPEDPSVTLYLYDRDILAVRVQWEDAKPSIEERWRIFDEPRLIECLRAIEAAKPASSWTAQELSYSVWW
jgi:hypothetical protein